MKYFAILALFLPLTLFAQVDPNDASQIAGTINFTLTPEMPAPRSPVSVRISAYGFSLDASDITWRLNGAVIGRGHGLTTANFTTGDNGTASNLTVTVTTSDGTQIERSFVVTPSSIDLLVEPETYTPPFYKGRGLWSFQSQVTVVAVPHVVVSGRELNPTNLVYTWSKDGTVLGQSSGAGKNSLSFVDSPLSLPTTITVSVSSNGSDPLGTASIGLQADAPTLTVYEDNPLFGLLLNNAIQDSSTLKEREVTFAAIPFGFAESTRNSSKLSYTWNLNGTTANQSGSSVTFRAPAGVTGNSNVDVSVRDTATALQSAEKNFLVQFGNNASL